MDISTAEAATRLGVSERTARRWCQSGRLRSRVVTTEHGQEWRIEGADLAAAKAPAPKGNPWRVATATPADTPASGMIEGADTAATADAADMTAASVSEAMAALLAERGHLVEQLRGERDHLRRELAASQEDARQWRGFATQLMARLQERPPAGAIAAPDDATRVEPVPAPEGNPLVVSNGVARPLRRPRPLWMLIAGYRPRWWR